MAKGKDGNLPKKELKNPELLKGNPEVRTPEQIAGGDKKVEVKKETETYSEMHSRRKEQFANRRVELDGGSSKDYKNQDKSKSWQDKIKSEREKDRE